MTTTTATTYSQVSDLTRATRRALKQLITDNLKYYDQYSRTHVASAMNSAITDLDAHLTLEQMQALQTRGELVLSYALIHEYPEPVHIVVRRLGRQWVEARISISGAYSSTLSTTCYAELLESVETVLDTRFN